MYYDCTSNAEKNEVVRFFSRNRRFLTFLPIFAPSKGGQLVLSQADCCLLLLGLGKKILRATGRWNYWGPTGFSYVFVDFPKGKSTQFFGIGPQIQDVDGCILQDNSMVNLNYQVLPAGSLGNVYATMIEITESPHMLHAKIAGNVRLFGYPHLLVMIFVTSATDSFPMSVISMSWPMFIAPTDPMVESSQPWLFALIICTDSWPGFSRSFHSWKSPEAAVKRSASSQASRCFSGSSWSHSWVSRDLVAACGSKGPTGNLGMFHGWYPLVMTQQSANWKITMFYG